MEYTLRVPKNRGGAIPLLLVADAMARVVATHNGTLPFHCPTYDTAFGGFASDLLNAARSGRLLVCNQRGAIGTTDEIIKTAEEAGTVLDSDGNVDSNATDLHKFYTTTRCLNDWRQHTGDTFTLIDMPVKMVELDLADADGKVIVPGYYRGFVADVGLVEKQTAPAPTPAADLANEEAPDGDEPITTTARQEQKQDLGAAAPAPPPDTDQGEVKAVPEDDQKVTLINRNKVIGAFAVKTDADENLTFWDDKLGRPPKWLEPALAQRGKPGESSLWSPLIIAHCLLDKCHMNLKQLDSVMHKGFPELYERWKEESQDKR